MQGLNLFTLPATLYAYWDVEWMEQIVKVLSEEYHHHALKCKYFLVKVIHIYDLAFGGRSPNDYDSA